MRSVGSHSTSGREKEGIKERTGWEWSRFGALNHRLPSKSFMLVCPGYLSMANCLECIVSHVCWLMTRVIVKWNKSPGICLTAEENLGKSQLGDSLMKSVWPVIASNGFPSLQMWSIGWHSKPGREKLWKTERILIFQFSNDTNFQAILKYYISGKHFLLSQVSLPSSSFLLQIPLHILISFRNSNRQINLKKESEKIKTPNNVNFWS